ncbi:MAG: hypothetical protein IJP48_04725 [Synergistaceae bacterium]|nr:hypothetical protein [Synergistaceae bacterium]
MSDKKFMELLSSDAKVRTEVLEEAYKSLLKLAEDKGFFEDAMKVRSDAMTKIAEAHGFKAASVQELTEEDLASVAGGFQEPRCNILGGYIYCEGEHMNL